MAHFGLAEHRVRGVDQHEVERRNGGLLVDVDLGLAFHLTDVGLRQEHGRQNVDLTRHDRVHAVLRLGNDLEDDLFERGLASRPVIGVLHEGDLLAGRPLRELEGAGADRGAVGRVGGQVAGAVDVLRQDRGVEHLHLDEERCVGLLQLDLDGHVVGRADRLDAADDALRASVLFQAGLERPLDVFAGEGFAVMPLHAAAQLEGVGLLIGADSPRAGELRLRGAVLVDPDETFEDLGLDVERRGAGGEAGVERFGVVVDDDNHRVVGGVGAGVSRAPVATAAAGGQGHGQRECTGRKGRYARTQRCHWVEPFFTDRLTTPDTRLDPVGQTILDRPVGPSSVRPEESEL